MLLLLLLLMMMMMTAMRVSSFCSQLSRV